MNAPRLTEWFGPEVKPTLIGRYEVRNYERSSVPNKHRLTGRKDRWWDGDRWLTWEHGKLSIMGRHRSHQWRGLAEKPA